MGHPRSILVIEDDADIADIVAINARDIGLSVEWVRDGASGLERALRSEHALVVLDLMLPELDGLEVCKGIRRANLSVPILMLTARSDELDKVVGLEIGADDYVTKPFGVRELMARIKALLRRAESEPASPDSPSESVTIDEITMDFVRRRVTVRGAIVELTAKEFDLLALFMRSPGRAFTRSQLLDLVWGYQFDGYDHTVNSHINRLRNKIELDPSEPAYLQTVWGVGYRFAEPGGRRP